MMAYDSQLVLAIIHNGSPVREINGKVTLPFNSEYKIRLKNKHPYLRAKARVFVDGRKASNLGDFIVHAGETVDLERFLDESMTSGRRFKFVPLSDGRVNDPTDPENGIIKVEFYREVDFCNRVVINPDPWPTQPIKPRPYSPRRGGTGSPTFDWYVNTNSTTFKSSLASSSNSVSSANYLSSPGQEGATVEGGRSGQKFVEGDDFLTETFPVTLQLRIQGPKKRKPVNCPEVKPPRKPVKARYCPECGARRIRNARFCHRCGAAYPRPSLKRRRR